MKFLFSILCLVWLFPLHAIHADPSSNNFEMRQKKRMDSFDFSGEYPNLENIDIDAHRKKNVEFILTGEYPILESVNYEGSFGILKGKLTGIFPMLTRVGFLCTNAKIDFDLNGDWQQSCEVNIRGMKENVSLKLPENIGVIVNTRTKPMGKVIANGLKKQGWGLLNKTYVNPLVESSPIVMVVNVEVTDGTIILN